MLIYKCQTVARDNYFDTVFKKGWKNCFADFWKFFIIAKIVKKNKVKTNKVFFSFFFTLIKTDVDIIKFNFVNEMFVGGP